MVITYQPPVDKAQIQPEMTLPRRQHSLVDSGKLRKTDVPHQTVITVHQSIDHSVITMK